MARSDNNTNTQATTAALKSAVTRVMRPLVGLLMEHGLTYPWLSGLLKSVFVDVAEKEFRLQDKRQTDSRITLLTGVHRKDVRRLRHGESPEAEEGPPGNVFLGAYLVAIWTSDERFLDEHGEPRPLARLARGEGPNFEELVTRVSKDIRPRAVLDEWLRLGAVDVDENDCVRLKTEAFIPSKGFEEKTYYLGKNVSDHIAAARYNVRGDEPPLLERSVYYDGLSDESVESLNALARKEGMRLLQIINRRASELQSNDNGSESPKHRINFGLYFFHESEPSDSDHQD